MINNGLAIGDFIGRAIYGPADDPDTPADNERLRRLIVTATNEYNSARMTLSLAECRLLCLREDAEQAETDVIDLMRRTEKARLLLVEAERRLE